MFSAERLLQAHPLSVAPETRAALAGAVEAALGCAAACTACADGCLSEEDTASLSRAAAAAENCATICAATASTLLRQSAHADREGVIALLQSCTGACLRCERECREHELMHDHCRWCVEATTACVEACERLIALL
ncbi:four-helix bundle copper-binding protein [Streptomyces sp. NPDC046716]|uniref:four-helix bundle copper-binding protein n=1 Tax=Streptomyces sp. NPDC046716 TaxID=3157093 RepID=UPI0033C26DEC